MFQLTRRLETRERCEHQKHDWVEDVTKIVHHIFRRLADIEIYESDPDGYEEVNQNSHHGHRWIAWQEKKCADQQVVSLPQERRRVEIAVVAVALRVENLQLGRESGALKAYTNGVRFDFRRKHDLLLRSLWRWRLPVALIDAVLNFFGKSSDLVAVIVRGNLEEEVGGVECRRANEVKLRKVRHNVLARPLVNTLAFGYGVNVINFFKQKCWRLMNSADGGPATLG